MDNILEKEPNFLRRMYNWCLEAADTKRAQYVMYAVAFVESSFFPLPPDLMLIPMVLANRLLAWRLAFWATIASVIGGMLGYAIGYYLFATLGQWIIETYNLHNAFYKFQTDFQTYGFLITRHSKNYLLGLESDQLRTLEKSHFWPFLLYS